MKILLQMKLNDVTQSTFIIHDTSENQKTLAELGYAGISELTFDTSEAFHQWIAQWNNVSNQPIGVSIDPLDNHPF